MEILTLAGCSDLPTFSELSETPKVIGEGLAAFTGRPVAISDLPGVVSGLLFAVAPPLVAIAFRFEAKEFPLRVIMFL